MYVQLPDNMGYCQALRREKVCSGGTNSPHLALDLTGVFMVYCASHAYACSQDLLHRSLQLPRAAAVPHDPRNLNDLLHLEVAAVLDVLLLHQGVLQISH